MLSPFVVAYLCTIIVATTTAPPENRNFGLQISSISIKADPELVAINITHKAASISFTADIKQQLNGPMKFDSLIQIQTRDTIFGDAGADAKTFRTFVNTTIDLCTFLNNPTLDPIMNLVYQQAVNKPGNHIFTKCPIQVGRYNVTDGNLDFKLFPGKMPSFLFKIHVTMYLAVPKNKRIVYEVFSTGQVGNRPAMGRRRTRPHRLL